MKVMVRVHKVSEAGYKRSSVLHLSISPTRLCVRERVSQRLSQSQVFTMKTCVLLLLVLGCVYGAPVDHGLEAGSCDDPAAVSAAHLALSKINLDRTEGYVFSLHRLSNVHFAKHEEVGVVYYLTLDVEETNCSVISRKDWKDCEARPTTAMPVYGQCKAAIFISKPHRVVRLYKYRCLIRPAPAARVAQLCPDCPTFVGFDNEEIKKTVTLSLEKFNKESNYHNRFALRHISRATAGMAMDMSYHVEYTIQETTCGKHIQETAADPCPLMTCDFAHLGFCKASHYHLHGGDPITTVNCEIYESETSAREKALHLLGDATDHSHNDSHTHAPGKDHGHGNDHGHSGPNPHDHIHDHTKDHSHHHGDHPEGSNHHHTHDHKPGSAYRHAHDHSHDHGLDSTHDHVHAHHNQASNHTGDFPNQHHNYTHPEGMHTHEHDHEIALDHDHRHAHLHEHEHHHHHHTHEHEKERHDEPEGIVKMIGALGQQVTSPIFPEVPPQPAILMLKPDPEIPGVSEPGILGFQSFPNTASANCAPPAAGKSLVSQLFAEDDLFKPGNHF